MNGLLKLLILISLISSISLLSCTENSPAPLRIGTNVWLGYEPLYLAREKNYFNQDKIRLVEFSSASQVIQAYRNELIDAAALTLDEVLLLLENGEKFTIVLVMDISNGGDAIVSQSNIKSLTQLKGKRIGVENNALGAYVITRALEISKIDPRNVNIIKVDINEQGKAFTENKVDAVVTFDPVLSKLTKQGGNIIFDSKQMPGEIVDVLIVRNQYIKQHRNNVQTLLDAWYKSLDYKDKAPEKAAQTLGKRSQLSVKETLAAYKGLKLPSQEENISFLLGDSPKLLATAQKLTKTMINQNLIKKNINPSELFNDSKLKHR